MKVATASMFRPEGCSCANCLGSKLAPFSWIGRMELAKFKNSPCHLLRKTRGCWWTRKNVSSKRGTEVIARVWKSEKTAHPPNPRVFGSMLVFAECYIYMFSVTVACLSADPFFVAGSWKNEVPVCLGDAACEGGHQIVFVVWVELMLFTPVTSKVACASSLENLGSGTLMTMRATYTPSVCGTRAGNHLSFFLRFSSTGTLCGTAAFPNSVMEIPRRQFEALLFQYAEGEGVWVWCFPWGKNWWEKKRILVKVSHDSIQSDWGNAVPWLMHSPRKLKFEIPNQCPKNVQIMSKPMSK